MLQRPLRVSASMWFIPASHAHQHVLRLRSVSCSLTASGVLRPSGLWLLLDPTNRAKLCYSCESTDRTLTHNVCKAAWVIGVAQIASQP